MTGESHETRGPITRMRVDTAAEARRLVHALVAADADDDTLRKVRDLLEEANATLAPVPRRPRALPDLGAMKRMQDSPEEPALHAMADRAVVGPANPTSVDVRTRFGPDGVEADAWFGAAFEGAPGRVHGGVLAAVLDDLLGMGMALQRSPGFTGRLTVHYRAPVPIETLLALRAWTGTREGRKLHVHADVRLDDRVLATADALFVLVDREHFATRAHDLLARDREG